jgi:hypothetical protein
MPPRRWSGPTSTSPRRQQRHDEDGAAAGPVQVRRHGGRAEGHAGRVQADEKAGKAPTQDKLNLLLYAAQKKNDAATESLATEKLLNYYPRKELWAQMLGACRKKGFSPRFSLDVYRLQLATGNMRGVDDYMEMAQLAAQAGYPEEGKKVVEQGLAANVLGQGAEGARHKRLLDLMVKKIAEAKADANAENASKTGDELVKLGLAGSAATRPPA